MLDHLGIQVADVDASARFYLDVFAPIGIREVMRIAQDGRLFVGLGGPDGKPDFWLGSSGGAETREIHLALAAPDRAAVDAVYAAALARGVVVLHAPRLWPEYHPGYYGVFLRDLDGHNLEAVHHTFADPG